MSSLPEADKLHHNLRFFEAKKDINKSALRRRNSIYDDGSDHHESDEESFFMSSLVTLLNNITLHSYRALSEAGRPATEKILWSTLHFSNACFFIYILISGLSSFAENPLVTTLHDTIYPVEKVPFPAIAICSNNRISLSAAQYIAQDLSNNDPEKRSVNFFLDQVKFLGRMYDFDQENENDMILFQQFLDQYLLINDTFLSDLNSVMRFLAPQCSELLLRCFWMSEEHTCVKTVNISEIPLFFTRRTQYGHCCTFNYVRKDNFTESVVTSRDQHFDAVTGPEMGLMLTVKAQSADYFYSLFNTAGFNVLIFDPLEYPDSSSGGVVEKFVSAGTETFVRIDATTISSEESILQYDVSKRECLYSTEAREKDGTNYERGTCILNCRMRSVIALCGCVPFFMYVNSYKASGENLPPVCGLQNNGCLNKYIVKWQTVITKIMEVEGLEREMEESLYCPECIPSCSDVKYSVSISSLPLITQARKGFDVTNNISDISDLCIMRIFFGTPETWLYKQDVALYWFEILSNFGGMVGLLAGFSMVSGLEIIFFLANQLRVQIWETLVRFYPHLKSQVDYTIYP